MIENETKKLIGYLTMLDYNSEDRSDEGNVYFRKIHTSSIQKRGTSADSLSKSLNWLLEKGLMKKISGNTINDDNYCLELIDLKEARTYLE